MEQVVPAHSDESPGCGSAEAEARAMVAENTLWYHTMELAEGVVTPGWFDLRPIVARMPWPDVAGKRCLDVGPYDGFIAFELERRGASEVVATDIGDVGLWDWAPRLRESGPSHLRRLGTTPGTGFEIAKRCLGSAVERIEISVYDLSPENVGTFDVVTCGSLLLHLRDPMAALEAIRGICSESFLSAEQVDPGLSIRHRKRAAAAFRAGDRCQWWVPNVTAHARMLTSAGFAIERSSRPYSIPLGPGHRDRGAGRLSNPRDRLARWLLTRGTGISHVAVLSRPERMPPAP